MAEAYIKEIGTFLGQLYKVYGEMKNYKAHQLARNK